jgi:hypothetical protein
MSDVNWRDIKEDRSLFYEENCHRKILVVTDVGVIRESVAKYVDRYNFETCCEEYVVKYAYLN